MTFAIIWLIIELLAWHRLYVMFPTHRALLGFTFSFLVFSQLFTILAKAGRKYRLSVDVNQELREAEDAMEEAMQEPDNPTILSRYEGLSTKPTREMTADELLEHARQLHSQTKPKEWRDQ